MSLDAATLTVRDLARVRGRVVVLLDRGSFVPRCACGEEGAPVRNLLDASMATVLHRPGCHVARTLWGGLVAPDVTANGWPRQRARGVYPSAGSQGPLPGPRSHEKPVSEKVAPRG